MNKFKRFFNVFRSLLMIAIGIIILAVPNTTNYVIVCIIIGVYITYEGLKKLFFYFSSARHMVGGGRILINSIINIDLGLLSFFVLLESEYIAMLYLVAVFTILGVIDILRSIEIKKNGSKTWIVKLIKGILAFGVGIVCFVFATSPQMMLIVFGIAWIVLAVEDIIASFSKAAVTYIPEI